MEYIFILNPAAGKNKTALNMIPSIQKACKKAELHYQIHISESGEDITNYVKMMCTDQSKKFRFYAFMALYLANTKRKLLAHKFNPLKQYDEQFFVYDEHGKIGGMVGLDNIDTKNKNAEMWGLAFKGQTQTIESIKLLEDYCKFIKYMIPQSMGKKVPLIDEVSCPIIASDSNPNLHNIDLLPDIYDFIENQKVITFSYNTGYTSKQQIIFHPHFLKEYNNRWFLWGDFSPFFQLLNRMRFQSKVLLKMIRHDVSSLKPP